MSPYPGQYLEKGCYGASETIIGPILRHFPRRIGKKSSEFSREKGEGRSCFNCHILLPAPSHQPSSRDLKKTVEQLLTFRLRSERISQKGGRKEEIQEERKRENCKNAVSPAKYEASREFSPVLLIKTKRKECGQSRKQSSGLKNSKFKPPQPSMEASTVWGESRAPTL